MRKRTADEIIESVRCGYNTIAAEFSATRNHIWWPEIEAFKKRVNNGDRVLDLGCGSGRARRIFDNMAIEYEGLDISEDIISGAKRSPGDLLTNFKVGSILALPYEDQSFDAVLAIASLHHVPSKKYRLQALRETFRVLKPGGYFMMTNWDLWKVDRRFKWLLRNMGRKIIGKSKLDWTDVMMPWTQSQKIRAWRYYHGFTLRELDRICRKAGFEVISNIRSSERRKKGDSNLITICRRSVESDKIGP